MELMRVLGIAVIGALLSLTLARVHGAYGMLISIATGCLLLLLFLPGLEKVIASALRLSEGMSFSSEYAERAIRVLGLSCLAEAGSRICRDAGQNSIAFQVELGGRVMILLAVLPALGELLTAGTNLLAEVGP